MAFTIISADETAPQTATSNDTLVLEEGAYLTTLGAAIVGSNVTATSIRIYGAVIADGDGMALTTSDAVSITIGSTGTIEADGYGIYSEGSKGSILNRGSINSFIGPAVYMLGGENVLVNDGLMGGFNYVVLMEGASNHVVNHGTMSISSYDSDYPPAGNSGTVTFIGATDESNFLDNFGTISGLELAVMGSDGNESVTNTGIIRGDISLGAGVDQLINMHGHVYGSVDLGEGDDLYVGGTDDVLYAVTGGGGDDTYVFLEKTTRIIEEVEGGFDTVQSDVSATLNLQVEWLVLTGSADINGIGNATGNQIDGNGGDNRLIGRGGDDVFNGYAGADVINGGAGSDWAYYETSDVAVSINLALGKASGGDAEGDRLISIEYLVGSEFDDMLTGSAGGDVLYGQGGNDRVDGGKGNDGLNGGIGKDVFVFSTGSGSDTLNEFTLNGANADRIDLSHLAGITNLASVKSHMVDSGANAVLTVRTDILTILNVHEANLNVGDFIF